MDDTTQAIIEDIELILNEGIDPITLDKIEEKVIAKEKGLDKAKIEVIKAFLVYAKRVL